MNIDLSCQIMEWSGAVLGLIGAILVARKYKSGFIIFSTYNLLWLVLGIIRGQYGISFLMITYLAVNIYGYIQWAKDEKMAARAGFEPATK